MQKRSSASCEVTPMSTGTDGASRFTTRYSGSCGRTTSSSSSSSGSSSARGRLGWRRSGEGTKGTKLTRCSRAPTTSWKARSSCGTVAFSSTASTSAMRVSLPAAPSVETFGEIFTSIANIFC